MPRSKTLAQVRSIHEMDVEKDVQDPDEPPSLEIPNAQVKKLF